MNAMKKWMKAATTTEQKALAGVSGASRNYLYQIASGHRTPTASVAARIEIAAAPLIRASKGRLPELTRADLADACANCPYAKKCLNR